MVSIAKEVPHAMVGNVLARPQVQLLQPPQVHGNVKEARVGQLVAAGQVELFNIGAPGADASQAVVGDVFAQAEVENLEILQAFGKGALQDGVGQVVAARKAEALQSGDPGHHVLGRASQAHHLGLFDASPGQGMVEGGVALLQVQLGL